MKKSREVNAKSSEYKVLGLHISSGASPIKQMLSASKFTLFVSPKSAEKSPVISRDYCVPSSVPHSGFGTLDLANLDAGRVLPLMPTYPIKLVCESRPLSAQHHHVYRGTWMTKQIEPDREMDIIMKH